MISINKRYRTAHRIHPELSSLTRKHSSLSALPLDFPFQRENEIATSLREHGRSSAESFRLLLYQCSTSGVYRHYHMNRLAATCCYLYSVFSLCS